MFDIREDLPSEPEPAKPASSATPAASGATSASNAPQKMRYLVKKGGKTVVRAHQSFSSRVLPSLTGSSPRYCQRTPSLQAGSSTYLSHPFPLASSLITVRSFRIADCSSRRQQSVPRPTEARHQGYPRRARSRGEGRSGGESCSIGRGRGAGRSCCRRVDVDGEFI